MGLAPPLDPAGEQAALAGMASETVYILQTWVAGRGGALQAGPQVGCRDAEAARRKAERLAPLRLGGGGVFGPGRHRTGRR